MTGSSPSGWECPGTTDQSNCAPQTDVAYNAMFEEVADANWQQPASQTTRFADPYSYYGDVDDPEPHPFTLDPYAYHGGESSETETESPPTPDAAEAARLKQLTELPQSDTLEKGMVLYDIAREALVARSAVTGEQTDKDSILRECNRIMVLNGYPDANLEGKSNITMADLPRAWNGVRWNQEFKLYDEAALQAFSKLTKPEPEPEVDPQPEPLPEVDPQPEVDPRPEVEPKPEPEVEPQPEVDPAKRVTPGDPNAFFICQFRNETYNPNGPSSSNDCGPTSLAMIARYYDVGFTDPGSGTAVDSGDSDPAALVSSVRYLMTGGRDSNALTGMGQIKDAATQMGFDTSSVQSLTDLDQAMDAGRMIVLAGNPKDYQKDLGLHYGKGGTIYDGGHFITVVGKEGDKYIVNDPANHGGSMELTREQIETYMGYFGPENRGLAVYPPGASRNSRTEDEPELPPEVSVDPTPAAQDSLMHMNTVDGFRADQHPDLNLDLRGFNPISDPLPTYNSDTGQADQGAPQLASLFGTEHPVDDQHLPKVRRLYRVNGWNWNDAIPKSDGKGTRGEPITSTEVTMLGFESNPGEPIYLPASGYRVDQQGNQGQILYLDREKGEITVAYNLSGTVAGGYTIHIRGAQFDPALEEGGMVGSDTPLGVARDNEVQVAITDRGTFMDIRHTNHWWRRRNRRGE